MGVFGKMIDFIVWLMVMLCGGPNDRDKEGIDK